ncbi:hypothetical protein H2198_004839 [Neophaeococcomyces mojaviensis]|uniref:Uncharacterized protein n=1 Tax=Neophaeococcomyces mojaviensis TaxID=3383035 RepID=A0ACC3A7F6_9EURO|nr:hypothetical protein H2198_004839 [Knufia sp. JES_112]
MLTWKGVVWHVGVASLLPGYFAFRLALNSQYLYECSTVRTALLVILWMWWVSRMHVPYFTSPLRHLPNPREDRFFVAHEYLLRQQVPLTSKILEIIRDTPNDGLLALYSLFHSGPTIFPTSPDAVMEMVNGRSYDWHKPGADARFLRRILGNGLVIAEDQSHKSMRKSVAPAFAGKHIRDLVPLFYEKGRAFADVLASKSDSAPDSVIEIMGQMSRVTLDIIGSAGIGMDFDTIHNDENRLGQLYETITSPDRGPIVPFFLIHAFIPPFLVRKMYGTRYAKIANAIYELRREVRNLVAEKKASIEKTQQKDIIAIIMQSGDFSDEYLCDQLLTFLAAGHDTTASALTWTLYMLSLHPDKQKRLREECQEAVGGLHEIDADQLDRLPYMTAVCNEMLRLYPPVPVTARKAVVDTRIGDVVVPKGTLGVVSIWAANRMPSLWGEDADEFRPDRWLDGAQATLGGAQSSNIFSTFLHGPRSCIGQSFARAEMKCLLLALILRFQFELADPTAEVKVSGFVSIKPADGMRLKLRDLANGQKQ